MNYANSATVIGFQKKINALTARLKKLDGDSRDLNKNEGSVKVLDLETGLTGDSFRKSPDSQSFSGEARAEFGEDGKLFSLNVLNVLSNNSGGLKEKDQVESILCLPVDENGIREIHHQIEDQFGIVSTRMHCHAKTGAIALFEVSHSPQ